MVVADFYFGCLYYSFKKAIHIIGKINRDNISGIIKEVILLFVFVAYTITKKINMQIQLSARKEVAAAV